MRSRNYRKDSRLDSIEMNVNECIGGVKQPLGNKRRSRAVWMTVMGVVVLLVAGPTFGQFTVEPMKVQLQVTPGKIVKTSVRVRNADPNEVHTIDLRLVELTESEDAAWTVVDPNDPNTGKVSKLSSCKSWVRMSRSSVTLNPLESMPLELTLRIPRGLRGFYTAGILATIRPRPDMTGVVVVPRFLVPVIVEIEGRPVRPRVETTAVGMEFVPASGSGPATDIVSMRVENKGETYSRLRPLARIWSFAGGHWRVITTTQFSETGIIPGANLLLKASLHKSLPAGKYKIAGMTYVDGRPTRRLEKEVNFAGDPKVTKVAADAPLDVDPADLIIKSLPGATRTGMIKIVNATSETVNIRAALGLPKVLRSTVFGDVRGQDLDCTSWIKIMPEQFTLQGEGGRQNLQVIATMPNPAVTYPCYYSLLALWATYPDGQGAGVTTMPICIRDTNIQAEPEAQGLRIDIQDLGASKYLIAAQFGNFKTIHFTPITVKAAIIPTTGAAAASGVPRASIFLSGDPSLMLPFETRQFSGVMDFSNIPADNYLLVGRLEYAPSQFARTQKLIQVSIEGGKRVIRTLGTQQELGGKVEVKW
jgi:hypothetical protein